MWFCSLSSCHTPSLPTQSKNIATQCEMCTILITKQFYGNTVRFCYSEAKFFKLVLNMHILPTSPPCLANVCYIHIAAVTCWALTTSLAQAMQLPRHLILRIGPSPWCSTYVLWRLRKPFSFSTSYTHTSISVWKTILRTWDLWAIYEILMSFLVKFELWLNKNDLVGCKWFTC